MISIHCGGCNHEINEIKELYQKLEWERKEVSRLQRQIEGDAMSTEWYHKTFTNLYVDRDKLQEDIHLLTKQNAELDLFIKELVEKSEQLKEAK